MTDMILLGVVGAAHGIKGEVRVKTFTGDPLALGGYGPLSAGDGRSFRIVAIRANKAGAVVRFEEVTTREQAEALNGTELSVPRTALPDDLGEDEFYHTDLIGLEARDGEGTVWGRVAAVHEFGGGTVIELNGRKGVMIPFTRAAVPTIDLEAGTITVDPVPAGLVDPPGTDVQEDEAP